MYVTVDTFQYVHDIQELRKAASTMATQCKAIHIYTSKQLLDYHTTLSLHVSTNLNIHTIQAGLNYAMHFKYIQLTGALSS